MIKTIASHTVVAVIGIMIAVLIKSPRVQIVQGEDRIVEVVKWKTKVIRESYEVIVDEPCTEVEYIYNDYDRLHIVIEQQLNNYIVLDKEHRISILAGLGPKKEFVFGAGYAVNITNAYSLGFSALNNRTYITSFGLDF